MLEDALGNVGLEHQVLGLVVPDVDGVMVHLQHDSLDLESLRAVVDHQLHEVLDLVLRWLVQEVETIELVSLAFESGSGLLIE